jgi:hypothetical protein
MLQKLVHVSKSILYICIRKMNRLTTFKEIVTVRFRSQMTSIIKLRVNKVALHVSTSDL